MDKTQLLATLITLAALCGMNLYLTVLVIGVSVNAGWITLGPEFSTFALLGHPIVLLSAIILYVLEFFIDKIIWVNTAWDALHTLIRPVGAAVLIATIWGNPFSFSTILLALACALVTLMAHLTKAGLRLPINASQRYVGVGLVSSGEDLLVLCGLALVYKHPYVMLTLTTIFTIAFVVFAPTVYRWCRQYIHRWC